MDVVTKSFAESYNKAETYSMIRQAGGITDAIIGKIPVFSLISQGIDLYNKFRLSLFASKIFKFLFNIGDTTEDDRAKFSEDLSKESNEDAYTVMLDILDKLDNSNKVDILTNLMKAKVQGDLSIKDFIRLSKVLERIPYTDLFVLEKYAEDDYYEPGSTESLLSAGVLLNTVIGNEEKEGETNKYRLNALGALMLKHGLGSDINVELKNSTLLLGVPNKPISEEEVKSLFKDGLFPEGEAIES